MVQIGKGWSQVAVQAEPHSFHTLPLVQVVGGVAVIVKSVAMAKRRSRRNNIVVVENVTAVGQPELNCELLLYEYNCCWTAELICCCTNATRCSIVSLCCSVLMRQQVNQGRGSKCPQRGS